MLTSKELGVEPLEVGDCVYGFCWEKSLKDQLCLGYVKEVVSTSELREGYILEDFSELYATFPNKVYTRMEIEKSPEEPTKQILQHLKDLEDYALRLGRYE